VLKQTIVAVQSVQSFEVIVSGSILIGEIRTLMREQRGQRDKFFTLDFPQNTISRIKSRMIQFHLAGLGCLEKLGSACIKET
jgi:hypothetical protein